MNIPYFLKETRHRVVEQALAKLRARGIEPNTEVAALYARYVQGHITGKQLHAVMQQRAATIAEGKGQ